MPYDGKLSRTVWSGGKFRDNFKELPIAIRCKITGHEAADVRSWTDSACDRACSGITVHDDECRLICKTDRQRGGRCGTADTRTLTERTVREWES